MSKNDLQATLHRLRTEVEASRFRDPQAREHIQKLIADIEGQLAQDGTDAQHETLAERLKLAIEQFEVEHPTVATLMNQLLLAFSSSGF